MNAILPFLADWWHIAGLIFLGWFAHWGYDQYKRRQQVEAQFVVITLTFLMVLYYGFGIIAAICTILGWSYRLIMG